MQIGSKVSAAAWMVAFGALLAACQAFGEEENEPKASNPASAAFQRAYAAHLKGQFDEAIAGYAEAIRLDPKKARAYNNRGLAYQAKQDSDRAIADFTQAIQLKPSLSAAYTNRGIAYASKGELGRAMADYNEAIRLDPNASQAYKMRAAVYAAQGNRAQMNADLAQALKTYRPKYNTLAHQAVAAELELKAKDYLPHYEELDAIIDEAKAKITPQETYLEHDALKVLQTIDGILLRKRFISVVQVLTCDTLAPRTMNAELLANIDPRQLRFRPREGETFHLTTPLTDTLIYASIGQVLGLPIEVALTPGSAYVKWRLPNSTYINWDTSIGLVRMDVEFASRFRITKTMVENGIYLRPVPPEELLSSVYHNIGLIWSGDWPGLENEFKEPNEKNDAVRNQKAADAMSKAIELNTKAYESLIQRAQCWQRLKEFAKAVDDNTLALELDPDQPPGFFGRGLALLMQGDPKRAIADFDKALSLDPSLPTSYYFRGLARAQDKQVSGAMEDLNKAIELEPTLAVAYQARAEVWRLLGRHDKARSDEDRADALMGKTP